MAMPRLPRLTASRMSPLCAQIAGTRGIRRPTTGSTSRRRSGPRVGRYRATGCCSSWKPAPPTIAASPPRTSFFAAVRAPSRSRRPATPPALDASPSNGATSTHHRPDSTLRQRQPKSPSLRPGTSAPVTRTSSAMARVVRASRSHAARRWWTRPVASGRRRRWRPSTSTPMALAPTSFSDWSTPASTRCESVCSAWRTHAFAPTTGRWAMDSTRLPSAPVSWRPPGARSPSTC